MQEPRSVALQLHASFTTLKLHNFVYYLLVSPLKCDLKSLWSRPKVKSVGLMMARPDQKGAVKRQLGNAAESTQGGRFNARAQINDGQRPRARCIQYGSHTSMAAGLNAFETSRNHGSCSNSIVATECPSPSWRSARFMRRRDGLVSLRMYVILFKWSWIRPH